MPLYDYTGQLSNGAAMTGAIDASGDEEARRLLDAMGIQVLQFGERRIPRVITPLSFDDLRFFNEQLASLARSGLPFNVGLRMMARDLRRGRLQRAVDLLAGDLERGTPFETAIRNRAGLFPPLYDQVLRAGVANNQLGATLCNLNTHLSLMDSGRRLFWEAAVYPIIILVLSFALASFFMMWVMPEYEALVNETYGIIQDDWWGRQLPADDQLGFFARLLFEMSQHWPAIATAVITCGGAAVLALFLMGRSLRGRSLRESIFGMIPGVGGVLRLSLVARFAQAAALGAKAGQDLAPAFRLAAGASGSPALVKDAESFASQIESGRLAVEASHGLRVIPPMLCYAAHVAGGRGTLAETLEDLARTYDELARHRLSIFRMWLMPLMVLLSGMLIGGVVTAMLWPLGRILNAMTSG